MYYIWSLHYLLAKKIYRKRIKGLKKGAWSLAFLCVVILLLFTLTLLTNKALIGNILFGAALAPIGGLVFAIILIPLLLISRNLTSKKVNVLRKVIIQTRNVKRIHSILYVSFFVILYISTIIVWIMNVPYHH